MLLDASSGEQSYEPAAEPMNFYNDIDPKGCAWLGELMSLGLIPPGVIDNRSITDIDPNELTQYTQCHFFAGIGGWHLAIRWAGWPEDRPVWTGSCPCQPFSVAGKRKGAADERHLWPAFRDLIAKCAPPVVFGEQVASADGREWLAGVRADLEAMGYAVGAADLCAAGVGAPHKRQRLYWVADAEHDGGRADEPGRGSQGRTANWRTGGMADMQCPRLEGHTGDVRDRSEPGRHGENSAGPTAEGGATGWTRFEIVHCRDGKARRFEPQSLALVDGLSTILDDLRNAGVSQNEIESAVNSFPLTVQSIGRIMLLRGYGNAIIPQLAAQFVLAFRECVP